MLLAAEADCAATTCGAAYVAAAGSRTYFASASSWVTRACRPTPAAVLGLPQQRSHPVLPKPIAAHKYRKKTHQLIAAQESLQRT